MSQEHCKTKIIKSQHLNYEERKIIERLLESKTAKKQIARLLKLDIRTIRDEIKRGTVIQRKRKKYISNHIGDTGYIEYEKYFADIGQRNYEINRLHCGRKCKISECRDFVEFAEEKILKEKWSPDAVVGYAKVKDFFTDSVVSTKTLYNWIERNLLKVKNIDLSQKVARKPKVTRNTEQKKKLGKSIDERSEDINLRETFGNWEGDSVVGKDNKSSVLTLVERKSRNAIVLQTNGKNALATYEALKKLKEFYKESFSQIFKSITLDNGSEFAASNEFESLGTTIYYAHPYSAWERGQNEHFNGLLRRFLPKGKDLSYLTQDDLNRFANMLNNLPRRKLNYSTPADLFNNEISAIISA